MDALYKNILVAIDGSSYAETAFEEAMMVAKQNDAVLHILFVIENSGNYFGELTFSLDHMIEKVKNQETEKMIKRKAKATAFGVKQVITYVLYGSPKTLIADFSETQQAIDLIVVGKTGLNNLQRALIGSTTAYIINHAKVSVLVANKNK